MIIQILSHLCLFALLTLVASSNTPAQDLDSHRLYEEKCARCHDSHAGDFVDNSLVKSDGRIIGRISSMELRTLLDEGHGKLSKQEVEVMFFHLDSIQKSGRLFHDKCVICHGRAVELARTKLIIKNSKLIGRYSNRDMEEFLKVHGRLETDEVGKILNVFLRQLKTN